MPNILTYQAKPFNAILTSGDASLVRVIHSETHKGQLISACLSRFGGLTVLAYPSDTCIEDPVWQGENILAARLWIDRAHHEAAINAKMASA